LLKLFKQHKYLVFCSLYGIILTLLKGGVTRVLLRSRCSFEVAICESDHGVLDYLL